MAAENINTDWIVCCKNHYMRDVCYKSLCVLPSYICESLSFPPPCQHPPVWLLCLRVLFTATVSKPYIKTGFTTVLKNPAMNKQDLFKFPYLPMLWSWWQLAVGTCTLSTIICCCALGWADKLLLLSWSSFLKSAALAVSGWIWWCYFNMRLGRDKKVICNESLCWQTEV